MTSCSKVDSKLPDSEQPELIRSESQSMPPIKRKILISSPEASKLDGCTVNDFELGKTLGTGSFGRVRHALHRSSNEYVALKILKKSAVVKLKQVDHIMSEKNILKGISHPFIVSLKGSFQDSNNLYLALEYVPGGEFFTFLRRNVKLPANSARFYSAQIVSIFEYLHAYRIVYRDLKPENILIDATGYLKVTDFGFAKIVNSHTYTLCGTPEYIAPEVLLNKGHSTSVDFWCLGILIYEMLNGYPPFIGEDTLSVYQKILSGKIYFGKSVDVDAKFLIRNLLQADLTKRFGNLRNGIADVKECEWFKSISWTALLNKEISAPFVPTLSLGKSIDTSNFENYPEDNEEANFSKTTPEDPFANW